MPRGQGKVILLGEHGVVYGRPALAASLGRGVQAEARAAEHDRLVIQPWNVDIAPSPNADNELARALDVALSEAAPSRTHGIRVDAEVDIPGGAGLGCSAALGVAVVRALDAYRGRARNPDSLSEASLAWERVFHGRPSGVDGAMAAGTGLAVFRRGQPLEAVTPASPIRLVVGHSGEPGRTKETVAEVARQHEREPERIDQIFDGIASLVRNARLAAEAGDWPGLGRLFDLNQALLGSLMLSTPKLEQMCAAAREAGALGAKLTGGGGGGCMIALVDDDDAAERVHAALARCGTEAFVAHAGT